MSTEDQMAAVGRLATERAEAKRQMALLGHEAQKLAAMAADFGLALRGGCNADTALRGTQSLGYFIGAGGESRLQAVLTEYASLDSQVSDLSLKLRAAGID